MKKVLLAVLAVLLCSFSTPCESKAESKQIVRKQILEYEGKYYQMIVNAWVEPDFTPNLHMIGTDFQQAVWRILLTIPYGMTMTYGQITEKLAAERDVPKMSARAVGGAVGRNHISLIIPCHRVVGASGSLTGYAGGVERKVKLLQLEGA